MSELSVPRVAGVVLAFNPDSSVVDNVRALRDQVDEVFVVDNSPGEMDAEILSALEAVPDVVVLDQGGNVGVAAGFNAGMAAGLEAGADYVWIFDQDSTVVPGMRGRLVAAYREHPGPVGIVGPALRSHATGRVYRRESGAGTAEVDVLISSGSLFAREMLDVIGLHDEPLFIDYVDHDISLRARRAGYHNLKVYDTLLEHRFGDSSPVRLLGRDVYLSNYSPMRQYHMARNRTIVLRRYGVGAWFWEDLWFTTKAWTKVLLCERDRPAKVAAYFRGWRDGVRYRSP